MRKACSPPVYKRGPVPVEQSALLIAVLWRSYGFCFGIDGLRFGRVAGGVYARGVAACKRLVLYMGTVDESVLAVLCSAFRGWVTV